METKSFPNKYNYLIIGGGPAGTTAAETIRENDPEGSIALISDEQHPLYSRVMLSKPNFFLGKIPFDQIWLKGQKWYEEKKIDFLGGKVAVGLDPVGKAVTLADGVKLAYDKLLLAPGVAARKATVPGAEKAGVHYLRTLEDGQAIMDGIKNAKHAVVVGGGFISFEMTDLLHLAGIETTVVLRGDYFWQPTLDEASGKIIEEAITKAGVKILKQTEITEIKGGERIQSVVLNGVSEIACDLLIFGIGGVSQIDLARAGNIATARGILANEYLETSVPDVWAAGDIAEYKDLILEETVQLGSWVNAHAQGKTAGLNMVGKKEPFKFVSFYTTQGFGLNIAFVGNVDVRRSASNRVIIVRAAGSSRSQLMVANKELVGATLINNTGEMSTVAKLIEQNIDVSPHLASLADPNFDLKTLLK